MPTLIATECVLIALSGLPSALALEIVRDEVEPADKIHWQRLQKAAQRSRPLGEGPWGTVRAAEADGLGVLTASLDEGRHTITATRDGGFSEPDQFQFVLLAWDVAAAVKPLASTVFAG